MPDGNQGPFTYKPSPPQTSTSPQAFNIPGAINPAGGVARAIAFVRGLSGKALVLAIVVFVLQAAMPPGRRPSDLIGGFHGATESAEINSKKDATVDFDRRRAEAQAAPPANLQMEQALNQAQLQAQLKALEMKEQAAQVADLACMASGFVTPFFGDNQDTRAWRDLMKQGCHTADAIRFEINDILARMARQGSGIVQRSNPGTSAGLPPVASPALSR